MYSKKFFAIVVIGLSATLAGCSLPLFEDSANIGNDNMKLGVETKCLSNVLPIMSGFMNGTATPAEVGATWECFGNATATYMKFVRGENREKYKAREVARFFEDYFLDTKINDRLLLEIMHIKQMFVGGSADYLTRDELRGLIDLSNKLKGISLRVLPYMKVYGKNWKLSTTASAVDGDIRYFEEANSAIQVAFKDIAAIIEKNNQSYELQNLIVLLDEMSKLYGQTWDIVGSLKKIMPLIEKLKGTLMGGDEKSVSTQEWGRFALLGARGYVQYLRYYYFIDQTQDTGGPQIAYVARSFEDLFDYLREMVDAKPGRALTKQELVDLMQQLNRIFPDINISKEFVDEFMKLKLVFFGGSTERWVPEEFLLAKKRVNDFRNLTERILNYSAFYTTSWKAGSNESSNQQYFSDAENNLVEFGDRLGKIMNAPYDLNDLGKFMTEIEKAFTSPDPAAIESSNHFPAKVKKYLPVLIAYKNIVLSDENSTVPAEKWSLLLKSSGNLFSRGLYYYYFINGRTIFGGAGLASLSQFIRQSLDYLNDLLGHQPDQTIPYSETDRLIQTLADTEILPPDKLDAKVLQDLTRVLFGRILVPYQNRLNKQVQNGISLNTTAVLKKEFGIWVDSQRFMEVIFQDVAPLGITSLPGKSILGLLQRSTKTEGQKELIRVFDTKVPLTNDAQNRLVLSYNPIEYSYESVSWINLSRAIVRLVNSSYIEEKARIENGDGFSQAEANQLYADVKPFFVRWGLLDPANTSFADSRFVEANLFTPRANGNDLVDFSEGVDLFMMILSGLELDSMMKAKMQDPTNGCATIVRGPRPMNDGVSVDCFVSVYRKEFRNIFSSVPAFVQFQAQLNDAQFSEMMMNILKGTGWMDDPKNPGFASFGDLSLVPHVVQYIESIMQRFDADKNNVLERDEASVAYPVFKSFLRKAGGFGWDQANKAVLMWLLAYGKPPDKQCDIGNFIFWVFSEGDWKKKVHADRAKLASIIGFISDSIHATERIERAKELGLPPPVQPAACSNPSAPSDNQNWPAGFLNESGG